MTFAQRAATSEGKLQVELAQLNYMLPRLAGGRGTELSRLGGAVSVLEAPAKRSLRQIAELFEIEYPA